MNNLSIVKLDSIGLVGYTLDSDTSIVYGKRGKSMKVKEDKYGYYILTFTVDNKNDTRRLHRVVAEACIPNPNNYPIVMHKDNNKLNCLKDNLQWGTTLMNNRQCQREGRNPGNSGHRDYKIQKACKCND